MPPVPVQEEPHRVRVSASPGDALAAVGQAAEDWGAAWSRSGDGGSLELPVRAGLRHGLRVGRIEVERVRPPQGRGGEEGTEVRFVGERSEYQVWLAAVVILLLSAAGGVMTVIWPFWPELLELAAIGAVIALSGWFLVVSRLRNQGVEEFLETVAAYADDAD